MPLATAAVPGNTADDPLYLPAIREVLRSLASSEPIADFTGDPVVIADK
jgi:hypothetical protein